MPMATPVPASPEQAYSRQNLRDRLHFQAAPAKTTRYEDLIGSTPLIDLSHLVDVERLAGQYSDGIQLRLLAKVEYLNPGFSVKDRIVKEIFDDAERRGELRPGGTVVAASSGNTGAATAMLAAMRGYTAIITTSPKCSQEKMDSIRAYGATLLVSPPGAKEGDPDHYMKMADRMADENPGWFNISQYDNARNPLAHYNSLGPEIYAQTGGAVTHFIAGGSTGGTISGVGRCLKERTEGACRVVLADPAGSCFAPFFKTGKLEPSKSFHVEGVGKGDIPGCMNFEVVDEVQVVADDDTFTMCRTLAQTDGILAGGSSGMNVYAATKVAERIIAAYVARRQVSARTRDGEEGEDDYQEPAVEVFNIATILCDSGMKYLSKVYNKGWLRDHGFSTDRVFPSTRGRGPRSPSPVWAGDGACGTVPDGAGGTRPDPKIGRYAKTEAGAGSSTVPEVDVDGAGGATAGSKIAEHEHERPESEASPSKKARGAFVVGARS